MGVRSQIWRSKKWRNQGSIGISLWATRWAEWPGGVEVVVVPSSVRRFKLITVDSQTGEVKAMKVKKF